MILGLDPSTKTGYCLMNGGTVEAGVATFPKLRGMHRVEAFYRWAHTMLTEHDLSIIVIEGYGFANKNSLVTMVEVGTMLRLAAHLHDVPVLEVAPNQIKKYATGSGNSQKDQIMMAVYKRWGFEAKNNDEADAYVLAKIGQAYIGDLNGEILIKPQEEVIAQLTGKK